MLFNKVSTILAITLFGSIFHKSIVMASTINQNTILSSNHQYSFSIAEVNNSDDFRELEQKILLEMNQVRTEPLTYIPLLEDYRSRFEGNRVFISENTYLLTQEGVSAVDEAIDFLNTNSSVSALTLSNGMSLGAKDHVQDIGTLNAIGHYGSDGSSPCDRISRYGEPHEACAENISFGADNAQSVIMDLIIDDGVSSRGHRKNLFNPRYKVTGIACGNHGYYGVMCTINYAVEYTEQN